MNGNIPRMDYRQYRVARRLVHECCNYDSGNFGTFIYWYE